MDTPDTTRNEGRIRGVQRQASAEGLLVPDTIFSSNRKNPGFRIDINPSFPVSEQAGLPVVMWKYTGGFFEYFPIGIVSFIRLILRKHIRPLVT